MPNAALRNAAASAAEVATTVTSGRARAGERDEREAEADGLREPERAGVLELGRRAEARTDEPGVEHAVRRAAGGAEREDDGLGGEQPDRAGEQDGGEDRRS